MDLVEGTDNLINFAFTDTGYKDLVGYPQLDAGQGKL